MDRFTLNQEQAVLIIIDIQERLVPVMEYGEQIVQKTNTLIAIADALKIPIIVTEQYPKGLGKTVTEINTNLGSAATYEKITFSACSSDMLPALQQLGRKKVIITGMETHVCVFQTVRDLLTDGFDVFVVGDAVCSRTKENYQNGLALMSSMGAIITNTETVFFDLMKEAGSPQFKELSGLIK